MNREMREAARRLRLLAIEHDNEGHAMRERAFDQWRQETLFPQAINRRIAEIGANTWTE